MFRSIPSPILPLPFFLGGRGGYKSKNGLVGSKMGIRERGSGKDIVRVIQGHRGGNGEGHAGLYRDTEEHTGS